jgi:hypothetical protein
LESGVPLPSETWPPPSLEPPPVFACEFVCVWMFELCDDEFFGVVRVCALAACVFAFLLLALVGLLDTTTEVIADAGFATIRAGILTPAAAEAAAGVGGASLG